MMDSIWMIVAGAILMSASGFVYILPLRKRENWKLWLLPCALLCFAAMWLNYQFRGVWTVACQLLIYGVLFLMVNRCTAMNLSASLYSAIWAFVSCQAVYEVWRLTLYQIPLVRESPVCFIGTLLLFAAGCYLLIWLTVARGMPQGDFYQIGPRQMTSACILGGMFAAISYRFIILEPTNKPLSAMLLLCQVYCISLLYLQTELFKKSRMQKELDTLSFLYHREQERYEAACQNVGMVQRKCEELENQIRIIQQYLPEELRETISIPVSKAMRVMDSIVKTGNPVLDIVFSEKKLSADGENIQINFVADGKLLDFMEEIDIYTVFSNALDNSIEATRKLTDREQRLIDVLVHRVQNFLVINISNPLKDTLEFDEELPISTKSRSSYRGYGLRVLREAIEKYRGMLSIETAGGFFILKIIIPIPRDKQ